MIYLIIFLVFVYWITESISEAKTWKSSKYSTKPINPKHYHLIRLPETLSVITSHIILGYMLLSFQGVFIVGVIEIMGCIVYERIFCLMNYGDFFYSKNSKWLGIPHPQIWVEIYLFVLCFGGLIILL